MSCRGQRVGFTCCPCRWGTGLDHDASALQRLLHGQQGSEKPKQAPKQGTQEGSDSIIWVGCSRAMLTVARSSSRCLVGLVRLLIHTWSWTRQPSWVPST